MIRRRKLGEMRPNQGVGALNDAEKGTDEMAATLVDRVWAWLHETFPERQIYVRSDGRVQFFTFGASLQATLAGLSLIFLAWVAFATVNVIFKDRIIAAKDSRYQQMQAAYENRVADLQTNYDDLNGALVSAEDHFKASADELQAKQNTIVHLLGHDGQSPAVTIDSKDIGDADDIRQGDPNQTSDSVDTAGPPTQAQLRPVQGGSSELGISPQPVDPQPRTAKPIHAALIDFGVVGRLTRVLFGHRAQPAHAALNLPGLRVLAAQTDRLNRISADETRYLVEAEGQVSSRVNGIETVLRRTGINPNQLEQRADASQAVGGPMVPLEKVSLVGISDQAFQSAYRSAAGEIAELNNLLSAVAHVPLTTPVHGSQFERTSGFGARVDPFTQRFSFHPGVDFAGPWGAQVTATAPGTVVFAGQRGGYGNMVEIDHGLGMRTRYGHLSAILVRPGVQVAKGTPVGRLGSTGRSTGPHVHYEVWYDNVVRNPSTFIEAGHHV
ncbi:MAG TPA: peptidoglycan DD-metalloendopeptidase family protein [Rhizomicrobium sp.]